MSSSEKKKKTPLHWAAEKGDLKDMLMAVKQSDDNLDMDLQDEQVSINQVLWAWIIGVINGGYMCLSLLVCKRGGDLSTTVPNKAIGMLRAGWVSLHRPLRSIKRW